MTCCGQREKIGEAREEQKWDYIVSSVHASRLIPLMSTLAEFVRFQINNMLHAFLVWHSLYLRVHLNRRLWSGYLHCRKFALLQPLVRSGEAGNTFCYLQVDICWMHLALVGLAGV